MWIWIGLMLVAVFIIVYAKSVPIAELLTPVASQADTIFGVRPRENAADKFGNSRTY